MSPEPAPELDKAPHLDGAPSPLQPDSSFRDAARAAMWPQVQRLLELEPALRDPSAIEALKRYRVATRRLRAALRVFDDALPKGAVRDIAPDLADLARAVGRVRDLDVRIGGLPAEDDVQPIRDAWAKERNAAAADVARRLGTKRHARLLEGLAELVRQSDAAPKRGSRAVRDRAGSAVWTGFERLRATAAAVDPADLETLHALRIRAKRLRYTIEFLSPVLGADRDWLIAQLVALQDHLGELHDADLAAGAVRQFLDDPATTLTDVQRAAIEAYGTARAEAMDRLRATTAPTVEKVASATFGRKLSKAVLGP